VQKSLLKLLWAIAGLALSASIHAVGMGGINVASALGQPLKAEIDLMAVSKTEKDSLVARLASTDSYKTAGLDYPYGNKFKFEIQSRASGEFYIKVSSAQPINDPFVSLLVELSWSAGKLSREYTFLLDPVDYVPVQPTQATVQPVSPTIQPAEPVQTFAASAVPAVQVTNAVNPVEPVAPLTAVVPAGESAVPAVTVAASAVPAVTNETAAKVGEQTTAVEAEPAEQQAASAVAAVPEQKEPVDVHRGDSLYKIAARYKLADMNLERMLVALYRVNADQFDGRNMNRIRAGKILHLPSQEEYDKVTLHEAVKEIQAQAADWNAYRQKLASAATIGVQSQPSQQVATGKISSSVLDNAPVAKESAKEVLKLSRGEAPGDLAATGAGGAMSAQDKKNAAQEDAIAKAKTEKEGQERAALLEKNLQDMKRLAQLKTEAAALAQPHSAVAPAPMKSAEANAAKPKPKEPVPEPSLLDQIMSEPLYLAGGGAALLAVGLLGIMLSRRKKKQQDEVGGVEEAAEDVGSTTGRMSQPVVPSPDTGDFTRSSVPQPAAEPLQSESVDPISEADLFLNFGRDAQAEEILKEALQNTPNNHQIHLKLLGIYANRKDASSFSALANKLKESGDDVAWQQAVEMGRKLEPDSALYGGFKSVEDTGSATVQVMAFNAKPEPAVPEKSTALDFDFDAKTPATQSISSAEQDFLSGGDQTVMLAAGQGMDFDITSTNPAIPAAVESATLSDTDGLVFDVTGSHSFAPAARQEEETLVDDGGMEFTLDFPTDDVVEKPAAPAMPAGIGLAGISLNFDDVVATPDEPAAAGKDDQWQEVSTKLDLAKAYQEMGDNDGAREILEEVMREGDAAQREAAQALFDQLG
jgi:pilus assembly protein FimV